MLSPPSLIIKKNCCFNTYLKTHFNMVSKKKENTLQHI